VGMKQWNVKMTVYAREQLKLISDRRLQESLRVRLRRLEVEPEKQGKPLNEELAGYRSVRAVGQRYRIIYKIEEERVLVLVVMVGIRKEGDKHDAYAQAIKLARLGLLGQE
jgi:mRNA interferase RelE/StbE